MFFNAQKIAEKVARDKSVAQCTECLQLISTDPVLKSIQHALDLVELKFFNICQNQTKIREKVMHILNTEAFMSPIMHCSNLRQALIFESATQFIVS